MDRKEEANAMEKVSIMDLKFDENGLIPAIVQELHSGEVLMMAYMNTQSLQQTLATGEAHFWSRSRGELWHKGATSGNVQRVHEVRVDCDADTLLLRVEAAGPACHTGEQSCFYRSMEKEAS
jgi:phosphoribosyl-AMP cyclohydrolase